MKYFLFFICFCTCCLLASPNLMGQEQLTEAKIEAQLKEAKMFLISFKNDSAALILKTLVTDLTAKNQLNTPLGLRIQFRLAEALEKDHQDEVAIQQLLHIKEVSKEKEVWDVYANTCIILARLYEKIGRKESCLENLRQTQSTINKHVALDSLYPLFAVRYSSYHRIYADRDTALFYAQEVLRTAPKYDQFEKLAVGHMLMGMLVSQEPAELRLRHYKAAGDYFHSVEDYTGYLFMIGSVSRWYKEQGNYELALSYSDSVLVAAKKSLEGGFEERFVFSSAYRSRADIYKEMGNIDSAWHYLNKGYQVELEFIHQSNNEKVIAIDAQYEAEKNEQKIETQAQQIKSERDRKYFFLGLSTLGLLFAAGLSYFYIRLRNANRKTEEQSKIIKKKNTDLSSSLEQQIILQGEIHHRVKNNLQVIISLLERQQEELESPETRSNLQAMSNRIYSMSAIHDLLYQREGTGLVSILEYTENLCRHFNNLSGHKEKATFDLDIADQFFNLETLMPLGIILTELLTNSLKYAIRPNESLLIKIQFKAVADGYELIYKDNGPGFPNGELKTRTGGLGTYLLKSMSRQLSGHFQSYNDNGAVSKIFIKEKNK